MVQELNKVEAHFLLPSLEKQAEIVEKHRVDTLLYCPNPWALRHQFINQDTGETVVVPVWMPE